MIKKFVCLLILLMSAHSVLASALQTEDIAQMKIAVNNQEYNVILEENDTTSALQHLLPMTVSMSDLNNNEKYYYLEQPLPSNPEKVNSVSTGDIMLFGDDCLVVFYKDFETPYSYTRIGHIENLSNLEEIFGAGIVDIKFDTTESFIPESMK